MSAKLIDIEIFSDLTKAMGASFVAELATTFLDDAPQIIQLLRDSADQGDAVGYRQAAAKIRSRAGVFGATVLAHLARDIELAGLVDPDAYLPELEETYADTALALKTLIKS